MSNNFVKYLNDTSWDNIALLWLLYDYNYYNNINGNIKNSDNIKLVIKLYYTILYYTILYYTILYYTILYYTILYYTIIPFKSK